MRAWPPPRPDRPRGPRAPVLRPQSGVGLRLRSTRDRSADARASPLETQTLLLHCVGGPGGSPCESLGTPVSYRTRNCGPNGSRARSLKPRRRPHRPHGSAAGAPSPGGAAGSAHTGVHARRAHVHARRAHAHTRVHKACAHRCTEPRTHARHTCTHTHEHMDTYDMYTLHTRVDTQTRPDTHAQRMHTHETGRVHISLAVTAPAAPQAPPPIIWPRTAPPNTLRCGLSPREPPASPPTGSSRRSVL